MGNNWRVGRKIPLNVYDGYGRPICQCHTVEDALAIVDGMNGVGDQKPVRPRGAGLLTTLKGTQCCDPVIDGLLGAAIEEIERLRGAIHAFLSGGAPADRGVLFFRKDCDELIAALEDAK